MAPWPSAAIGFCRGLLVRDLVGQAREQRVVRESETLFCDRERFPIAAALAERLDEKREAVEAARTSRASRSPA